MVTPTAVGANTMVTLQFPPGGTVVQPTDVAKKLFDPGPMTVTLLNVNGARPVFCT